MQKGRGNTQRAGKQERADLAVFSHRVLAMLRGLDALDCDAVLRAALELNRPSQIRWSQTVSADESRGPSAES